MPIKIFQVHARIGVQSRFFTQTLVMYTIEVQDFLMSIVSTGLWGF